MSDVAASYRWPSRHERRLSPQPLQAAEQSFAAYRHAIIAFADDAISDRP